VDRIRAMLATLASIGLLAGARLEAQSKPAPPAAIHYLYLIRHGAYDRDDKADERVANGLNVLGHEQADLVGRRLAALPVRMTSIVSSDYTRARETADDIGRILNLPVERDSLLHECTPTTTRADLLRDNTTAEIAACDANLEAAWAKYVRPASDGDARDLLVCHGNVIRWFVAKALGGDSQVWATMDIANASITVLAVRGDGSLKLCSFSDVGHVPPERQTWTGKGAVYALPTVTTAKP
jgi:serine/threonine-protein phosphatase PGAM5